ncbi:MAG TPA: phosphate ABC transporter substrate-binding protein PstS [Candidatus Angelobacter sp.]|nr:phosphate ABC transporter substrate-binding protein PstS [Candidatus Angelobacter sp.]
MSLTKLFQGARFLWLLVFVLGLSVISCLGQESVALVGAGSTVPLPLFNKWGQEFNKISRGVQMQYQPLGTTEGLKLISGSKEELGKTDFSAGEVLLTDQERANGQLIQLPAVIIGIVPIYNLPGSPEIKFSGELLAQIFLGHVKTWNAPQIAKLNPGVNLPSLPIRVVYRPAGKGSNYVFTDFLSKTSTEFRNEIGRTPSPKWPVGESAERSADMVDKVKNESGSIGFVELQYALTANLPYGLVQNAAGKFVKATESSTVAACRAVEAPTWNKFSVSLTNAPGADSFPITSFSWLYLRSVSSDMKRRAALVNLLNFIYGNGQQIASLQGYSQLPPQLLDSIKGRVGSLK